MAIGALIVVPAALAGALGVPILPILVLIAACAASVWLAIRLSMLSPAVMVEGIRNPLTALQRSWQLTRGNAGRLLVFFALLVIVFIVVMLLLTALLGAVLGLALSAEAAAIGGALLGSILQAIFNVYMIGVVAACHRQLAGPTASVAASTFE
jgi:membrane-anchored glycerophosphoryl diester phosphodiesterase (GDPDase)